MTELVGSDEQDIRYKKSYKMPISNQLMMMMMTKAKGIKSYKHPTYGMKVNLSNFSK